MLKKSKVVLVVVPVVIVVLGAAFLFTMSGPNPAQFEYLKDPQIRILPDLTVLQVEAKGEPGVAAGQAFGLLFKTYFQLKGVPKGPRQPAPRARWPLSLEAPKGEWVGHYAMPVPDSVNSLPSQAFGLLFKTYFQLKGVPKGPKQPAPRARWPLSLEAPKGEWVGHYAMPVPDGVNSLPSQETGESGLRVAITTWAYGDVAEVLHVGPYNREEPTIAKLKEFIKECGYEIVGEHEEEYLKGPGMFFKGNPEKYLTIIRYRVKKAK